ncbi:MAG: ribosome small subunit-dependent GTPase A [Actinomycetota bacterium]|nr:ribosome small subunit-dependent GTPase A [Actinomycetota bacterium]
MSRIDLDAVAQEWEDADEPRRTRPPSPRPRRTEHPVGRVIGLHKGWVDVIVGGEEISAVYGGAMRGEHIVVGDRVRVRLIRHDTDTARVVDRLQRGSVLMRTADDTLAEERLLAANVDLAIVVIVADEGEIGARFADRILVAAEAGGLDGAICVNKIDVNDDVGWIRDRYDPLGYSVVATSAHTGEGLEELRTLLADRWSVLAGHSGVGKTSLSNLLVPGSQRQVGEVGRFGGRHVTVSPRALRVPGVDNAWLVDTPGVRSFGIAHLAPDDLAFAFPELRGLPCDLPGCLHDGEPGCAVPELLTKKVSPARYGSYQRFLAALRGDHGGW